ncbi:hypothetical protein [Mucilaginibacter polytrichastri]|uniref:Uncharacterized protein n=1 Tax=Mucilaginibacter polytrichastri TaxID=1302689 RepID=A0A1Q6A4X7_9SPHI|nr:hypothetical protein [Mucilaginibacter polytrichastri]OKS89052.1 hypothetical protein RG47T_4532 [Mucilaginibacter polytrichastri]SFS95863.1 hypothetical protein SAMN04487890_10794 [Mucilaginibacter polytrichastri]
MDIPIKTISDLHAEIIRLEKTKQQQEMDLKQRLNSPSSVFSAVKSLFPSSNSTPGSSIFNQDIVGLISRFVIPLTLNKTLFKGSGFLVKTLVGLVSQKASTYISEDSVTGIWDKAKGLVTDLLKKKDKPAKPNFSEPSATAL